MNSGKKDEKRLSESVQELVQENGGWIQTISLMTNIFDHAINKIGKSVDCPFPYRHNKGAGRDDFRFSDTPGYEGRAICSCMQETGMSAVELLMEAGIGNGSWTRCMVQIFKALKPSAAAGRVRKVTASVVQREVAPKPMSADQIARRKHRLTLIARDLVSLSDPSALPARRYFFNRGIPINSEIQDVKFHPSLEYWEEDENGNWVLVGKFPAIVSAFRSAEGRVVNFHRIYINEDGTKADVVKVKKILAALPGFRGSAINVAKGPGRNLHVTEGVEKGWAVHLVTGEPVKAAYSCGSLPSLHVDKSEYDRVVIWSDCDPINPNRKREIGDGQYFAWKLACRLSEEGFDVIFMMVNNDQNGDKGPDWEDVIVKEEVLAINSYGSRLQALRKFAVKGGVSKQRASAA